MKTARLALLLLGAAVLALPVGCQKGLEEKTGGNSGLTATIEQGQKDCSNILGDEEFNEVVTKTALTGNDYVCWKKGDVIWVNGSDDAHKLTVKALGDKSTSAMLDGSVSPNTSGHKYYGYYPASSTFWDVANKRVKLPTTITYNPDSPLANLPMYAESDDKNLVFKSLFGLMEFCLTGYQSVTSIKLSCASGTLAGTFAIGAAGNATAVSDKKTEITLNCPAGGIKLDASHKKLFYIPIPVGDYTDLRVDVYTDCGGEIYKTNASFKVRKGCLYSSTFVAEPAAVRMWAGGPYFATTNLMESKPSGYGVHIAFAVSEQVYNWTTYGTKFQFKELSALSANEQSKHPQWDAALGMNKNNNPYYDGTTSSYTKYLNDGDELEAKDDAATQMWGPNWQLPSNQDYLDLIANATPTATTVNGINGILWTSNTIAGATLFFPKAGDPENVVSGTGTIPNVGSAARYRTRTSGGATICYRFDGTSGTGANSKNFWFSARAVKK